MRSISAPDLLDAWARGTFQRSAQAGLSLLSTAFPDLTHDELSNLVIGERDRLLLQLREDLFGPGITGLVRCPECGELLEMALSVSDIRIKTGFESRNKEDSLHLASEGYEVSFRLPNCADLESISLCKEVTMARSVILGRCIGEVLCRGEKATIEDLPSNLLDSIAERMASIDPQADVLLKAVCVSCSHEWDVIFDIPSFLSSEIDSWALSTLLEVHSLATAYGWSEGDILAMNPRKRRFYLDMVSR